MGWKDHPGQPTTAPKEEAKKKKKGGGGKTVSSVYLVSLAELMTTLYSCEPHFVRCLVPNNHKKPGDVEPPLIMHQLTCNGVLEGIRICMRGFPNRLPYADFKKRYSILARGKVNDSTEDKSATETIIKNTSEFDQERDDVVTDLLCKLQGTVLGKQSRKQYKEKVNKREMIKVAQRNFRKKSDSKMG